MVTKKSAAPSTPAGGKKSGKIVRKAAAAAPVAAPQAAKVPKASKPAVVESSAAPVKLKQKLVRDGFTMPKNEYAVLDELKQRAVVLQRPVKKGEILRAGIAALKAMSDDAYLAALNTVPTLKTGRPKDEALPAA